MQKDLISVIVPCYNVSRFLPDAFASLENQTYKNTEFIFVNDGSKDDTLQKIEEFCKDRPACKVIDQQNQGVSAARNAGVAAADGEYLYFFDPDDMLAPNILEVLHKNMAESGCDLSICSFKRVKEDYKFKRIRSVEKPRKVKLYETEDAICQHLSMNVFFTSACNRLYKSSVMQKMAEHPNVFDKEISYGEDTEFNFRYMRLSGKTVFTPRKLYFYRTRKGSAVHGKFNEKLLSELIGTDRMIETCKNEIPSALKYALGFKCVYCTDILYRIYKSKYTNREVTQSLYAFLKENAKQLRLGKRNPRYRKYFMWTVPIYFKIVLRKELKK